LLLSKKVLVSELLKLSKNKDGGDIQWQKVF
jgi:hypothetical protein